MSVGGRRERSVRPKATTAAEESGEIVERVRRQVEGPGGESVLRPSHSNPEAMGVGGVALMLVAWAAGLLAAGAGLAPWGDGDIVVLMRNAPWRRTPTPARASTQGPQRCR